MHSFNYPHETRHNNPFFLHTHTETHQHSHNNVTSNELCGVVNCSILSANFLSLVSISSFNSSGQIIDEIVSIESTQRKKKINMIQQPIYRARERERERDGKE